MCELPPNPTAFLQPQDAGIIAALKVHIKRYQWRHMVHADKQPINSAAISTDSTSDRAKLNSLFTIDILTAMRWSQDAWTHVSGTTVSRCWLRTGLLAENVYEVTERIQSLSIASSETDVKQVMDFCHILY